MPLRCEDDTAGSFRSPLVLQFRFKDLGYLWAMLIPIASRKEPQKEEREETNPARNSHCNLPSLSLFPTAEKEKERKKVPHLQSVMKEDLFSDTSGRRISFANSFLRVLNEGACHTTSVVRGEDMGLKSDQICRHHYVHTPCAA